VTTLVSGANFSLLVDSTHPIAFHIFDNTTKRSLMNFSQGFEEGSVWCCELIYNSSKWTYNWSEDGAGSNPYLRKLKGGSGRKVIPEGTKLGFCRKKLRLLKHISVIIYMHLCETQD